MPSSVYFVNFVGFIDERKRPEGFPRKINDKQVFEVESLQHLQSMVNDRFIKLVSQSGLVVMKDDTEIQDENKLTFDKRVFVPWHMITHMVLEVNMMPVRPMLQDSIVPDAITPDKPKEWTN
jgi:hypothetical protein